MMRLLLVLIVAGLIAVGVAWLADNDGTATLVLSSYEVSMNASVALVLIVILALVLAVVIRLAYVIAGSSAKLGTWTTERRAKQFYQALSHGLIAAASDDAAEAGHFARRSDKLLRRQPLGLLLTSQAAHLAGDEAKEETAYRDMLTFPETEFLGLRGLYSLALRNRDPGQALAHATRAYALKPKAWATNALFDLRVSRGEWREAQALVVQATRGKTLTPSVARRRRAVLLAAQAVEADHAGDAAAHAHALEALALAPGLTAPALIASRHLSEQGRSWKAQDVIEAAWSHAPHRDLAEAYAAMKPEEDRETCANRLIALARLNPNNRESRVLLAEQLAVLHRWGEAQSVLAPLADDFSSARVCNLMATISLGQDDALTAQSWRSRAARAGQVTDWRCSNCAAVASEWGAVCPRCGAFDTLNWTTPEASAFGRERHDIVQVQTPVSIPSGSQPAVAIIDASSRSRASIPALPMTESPLSFLRPPDDPGPEDQSGIFEVEASEDPLPEKVQNRAR